MPTYERGDYVTVEFANEAKGTSEWMWLRVSRCDDRKQLFLARWTAMVPDANAKRFATS